MERNKQKEGNSNVMTLVYINLGFRGISRIKSNGSGSFKPT